MRRMAKLILICSAAIFAVSCATQLIEEVPPDAPGFMFGFLQGLTMLFALIGSFFFDVRIYAFPNSGWPYDLGYVIGAGILFFNHFKLTHYQSAVSVLI
jgi:hypothetical protein